MGEKYEIAVGLSGGVDSAVAAMLLLQQGHKVVGITMKIWDPALNVSIADGHGNACYGPDEEEDIKTCRHLCAQLGMEHIVIDLSKEYSRYIVRYFTDEYLAGRTPNPCVRCNAMMKFGFLIRKARENAVAFDRFATGHYARTVKSGDLSLLKRAVDQKKDQTYFLHAVSPAILSKTMFPLGDFTKEQVRALALENELPVANKEESQGFIAGGDYSVLFEDPVKQGYIVNESDTILGTHNGIIHYTIGQRKKIQGGSSEPLYVIRKDMKNNRIVVAEHDKLFNRSLTIERAFFHKQPDPKALYIQIRHNHQPAKIEDLIIGHDRTRIRCVEPQRAATPGQSAVIFENDLVIGGGIIV